MSLALRFRGATCGVSQAHESSENVIRWQVAGSQPGSRTQGSRRGSASLCAGLLAPR